MGEKVRERIENSNKGAYLTEKIEKEERTKRNYYCGRFGSNANLDDPLWSPFDNEEVQALHPHRTPYALDLTNYGLRDYRVAKAAGTEARDKTPTPSLKPAPLPDIQPPRADNLPDQSIVPPKSSPPRALTGAQRSDAAGSRMLGDVLEEAAIPLPSRGQSRHSASVGELPLASSHGGRRTGSLAASRRSLRTHSSVASIRSKISEAVQKEIARSELNAYWEALEWKKQRERQKQIDMPLHLRTGVNPIDTGCPCNYTTEQMRSLQLPIKMATDPKWSTELKRINGKVGLRLEWEKKIAASLSGSIIPERHYMPPKKHYTNPPTPYFKPGEAHLLRASH